MMLKVVRARLLSCRSARRAFSVKNFFHARVCVRARAKGEGQARERERSQTIENSQVVSKRASRDRERGKVKA